MDRNKNHVDRSYNLDRNIVSVKAYEIDEEAVALENQKAKEAREKAMEETQKKAEEGFVSNPLSQTSRRRSFTERLKDRKEREEKQWSVEQNQKIEKAQDSNKNKLNVIDQRFKYNTDGSLKSAYTGNMQYEYVYNIEGMLESKSASGRTLLSYTYDKNNNIKSIKDITGKSRIYGYDEVDRVKLIQDDDKNNLEIYDYYKNDIIKSITVGNGLKTDYTYDGDGNVQSLVTISSNGKVLIDYNYAYDLNGNRLQKVSSKHKKFYSYDSMNRLKEATYDGRKESFTYDKVGNRLTKTISNITEKYIYNVKNQLKELHNKNGINYFTYDKQGNTIKEETQKGNNIFEYNTLNQQVKAVTKEGNTLVNRYDTEGLRAEIEENEKLTKFIFHKENVLVETDKEFGVISRFTRGYEVVAADIAELGEGSEFNLNRHYYTVDEQGSTLFITDKNQEVKNEYWYDAFGNVLESKVQVHNRITYTGQQFDGVTGQYYLRARFYNPVRYYDPSGYMDCENKAQALNKESLNLVNDRTKVYEKLRAETQRKLEEWIAKAEDKKDKSLSQKKLRPAFSTSYNVNTKKYYYGRNLTKMEAMDDITIYHPYVNERVNNMDEKIRNSYNDMTHGAGTHAECRSLNESMLDEFCLQNGMNREVITQSLIDDLYEKNPGIFNQNPNDTIINVVNSGKLNSGNLATPGNPMPRCPHCKHIILKADVLPEVISEEVEYYKNKFPDLVFDK